MEQQTPETPQMPERPGVAPGVWVLILLAAVVLIFAIWWAVAAQNRERPMVTPPEAEEQAQVEAPPAQPPAEQPVVVKRERPVNIYVQPEEPRIRVIIVPQGERPPEAKERLRKVDLPGRFRHQGRMWEPTDEAFVEDSVDLKDSGASVDGNIMYVQQDAEPPYDVLYLESEPGSGIYIRYRPTGQRNY